MHSSFRVLLCSDAGNKKRYIAKLLFVEKKELERLIPSGWHDSESVSQSHVKHEQVNLGQGEGRKRETRRQPWKENDSARAECIKQ